MLMLVAVILPQVVLGAVLFFAPASLYPVYSLCGRAFNHLSELADQQLGALILWIPGSMMSVVAAILVMRHELAAHRPGSSVIPSVRGAAP
jgi:putative membrane protein